MATWEDGPEYAPYERPQYYADAPVPALEDAPPVPPLADGPSGVRPQFATPNAPVAPLETLVPTPPDERDPARPFDVLSASMTSGSGWGSGASSTEGFVATAPMRTSATLTSPAPSTSVAPEPNGFPPPSGPPAAAPNPYAYPSPGTPGWFAPPPATYGEQHAPGRVDAKQVVEAATPGLCICLAIGGLIYVLSPIMLVVAVFLSNRVQVAQPLVRVGFRIAAGVVGFFAVVGLFRNVVDGDPWWSFVGLWSLVICWLTLIGLVVVVWRALTRPAPQTPSPWG